MAANLKGNKMDISAMNKASLPQKTATKKSRKSSLEGFSMVRKSTDKDIEKCTEEISQIFFKYKASKNFIDEVMDNLLRDLHELTETTILYSESWESIYS